ncbi:MAG: PIN domain-containing protein [Candidatus Rokubacteria bacterium]|nr:PIN domain-containing protein [Candidatus Rokubacteria bacterium]
MTENGRYVLYALAPVDEPLALEAADLSLAHGLAMADSLVDATARRFGATLVTRDSDFEGPPTRS